MCTLVWRLCSPRGWPRFPQCHRPGLALGATCAHVTLQDSLIGPLVSVWVLFWGLDPKRFKNRGGGWRQKYENKSTVFSKSFVDISFLFSLLSKITFQEVALLLASQSRVFRKRIWSFVRFHQNLSSVQARHCSQIMVLFNDFMGTRHVALRRAMCRKKSYKTRVGGGIQVTQEQLLVLLCMGC